MTISYVYTKVNKVMNLLESVNCTSTNRYKQGRDQKAINHAYNLLEELKNELIKEHKRVKYSTNNPINKKE